ncbi:MAG: EAL domain-containing protein [Burkholderiaceae bacterium]|nr:EAL domain-containing protein [Burkholderiaceae bacterium]
MDRTDRPPLPPRALPQALQPLLDALIEAACLVDDASLQVLAANRSAAQLWGCSAADLVGHSVEALAATPEDQLFWMQRAHWPRGTPLHSDSLVCRSDGSRREVERRISAIDLPDGRPAWLVTLVDQTARRRAEIEVERLLGELGATLAGAQDAILVTDLDGQVRCWNAAFARLWQLPERLDARRDGARIGRIVLDALEEPSSYDVQLARRQGELLQRQQPPALPDSRCEPEAGPAVAVDRLTLRDGRTLQRRLLPQVGHGQVVGWVQVWRDLTDELLDQNRLQLAGQVFDTIQDAVLIADRGGAILTANPAAERLCGESCAALQGRALGDLLREADGSALPAARLAPGLHTPRWHGELQMHTPQGIAPVQATLLRGSDDGPHAGACIAVLQDQRERRAAERLLAEQAHTDALTGRLNRDGLLAVLMQSLTRHAGTSGTGTPDAAVPADAAETRGPALLLLGLDRFRHVNESLGHGGGDAVLREAARRLAEQLRLGDCLARLGSDQFAVLLDGADAATAEAVARRLLRALQRDLPVAGLQLSLSASVGIALAPQDSRDATQLLGLAERAMHRAKEGHGGDLRFYQPQMRVDRLDHIRLDRAMRLGLAQGDFRLAYQPQVALADGTVVGCEALCRWTDPELGAIPPDRFIPVAEETGFIVELGDWVLREAVAQAERWQAAGRSLRVSVNVSGLQFQQPGFSERVARLLQDSRLEPARLELELTESILVGDVEPVLAQLHALAALGVQLAVDDFGTGYSSLGYLRRLPIHRLKIDRSFIQRLPDDAGDTAITRTVVELGRALQLRVIAEGVETEAQRQRLAELGCDEYQGWLCAPALPADELEARLAPPRAEGAGRSARDPVALAA